MAITFELVSQGPNHLTYLATATAVTGTNTGTIQWTGAGDADVALSDADVGGLMKEIVDTAVTSDAEAQRLMLDWGALGSSTPNITNVGGKRCRIYLTGILADGNSIQAWVLTAVNNGGHPEVQVETEQGAAQALIYIEAVGTPQRW